MEIGFEGFGRRLTRERVKPMGDFKGIDKNFYF
jgi:hypothetical protein